MTKERKGRIRKKSKGMSLRGRMRRRKKEGGVNAEKGNDEKKQHK